MKLRVLDNSDKLLVEPRYDPDRIGLIYVPDSSIDAEPQQGWVLSAGRYSQFREGSYILFHRFRSSVFWVGRNPRLVLHDSDVVAMVDPNTGYPILRPHDVLVNPDWSSKYDPHKWNKTIALSQVELEDYSPVPFGEVEKIGSAVTTVTVGQRIAIPPSAGVDLGLINRNVYIIPEKEILAVL